MKRNLPMVGVVKAEPISDTRVFLKLSCGHATERRRRFRRTVALNGTPRFEDPFPGWVYCEQCQATDATRARLDGIRDEEGKSWSGEGE